MPQNTQQRPVAVVTDATSGIGLAIAQTLARDHQVYVIGLRLIAPESEEHAHLIPVSLDIRDSGAVADFVATLPA